MQDLSLYVISCPSPCVSVFGGTSNHLSLLHTHTPTACGIVCYRILLRASTSQSLSYCHTVPHKSLQIEFGLLSYKCSTPDTICTARDALSVLSSCAALPAGLVGDALHWGRTTMVDAVPHLSEPGVCLLSVASLLIILIFLSLSSSHSLSSVLVLVAVMDPKVLKTKISHTHSLILSFSISGLTSHPRTLLAFLSEPGVCLLSLASLCKNRSASSLFLFSFIFLISLLLCACVSLSCLSRIASHCIL